MFEIQEKNKIPMISNLAIIGYAIMYLVFILILPRLDIFKGFPQLIFYIVLGTVGFLVFWTDFTKGINLWKTHFINNSIWLAATLFGGILLQQIAAIPAYLLGTEDLGGNTEAILELTKIFPIPFIVLALGILGPITEEIIYRIILIGKVSQKVSGILCVILSSLIFMLIHVQAFSAEGFANVLPIFTTGLSYAIAYYKTKNITIPIIIHVLSNSISLAFMGGL